MVKKAFLAPLRVARKIRYKVRNLGLCVKYGFEYGVFEEKNKWRLKTFLIVIGCERFSDLTGVRCVVKPSKILFDIRKSNKKLWIFDRPASDNYWVMRNQLGGFHSSPAYIKVDERSYYQDSVSGVGNLLSYTEPELCAALAKYLRDQQRLRDAHGTQVSVSEFLKKPCSFLVDNGWMKYFPVAFSDRVQLLLESNEALTLVPSVVEPWPTLIDGRLMFGDLSPVEFRQAPFLHDLCYMMFKYELYGSRRKGHRSMLPLVFNSVKQVGDDREKDSLSEEILDLSLLIRSFVKADGLIDTYITMVLFHSYVKYHATGRFAESSAECRLALAISRHVSIFESIRAQNAP